MGDNPNNFIVCNGSPVTLTNAGNTNLGAGLIGDGNLTLVNLADGTIDGNASSGLIIQGGQPMTNAGLLEGTSAGPMLIRSVSVANTGTIAAPVASSVVQSASITGGTLKTANGGAILEIDRGSVLNNVTVAPGSNVTVTNNNYLSLLGAINNQGSVTLASAGNDTRLIPLGAVTLTGGGLITLSDNVNNFELSNFSIAASLVNLDNTITGAGRIGDQNDSLFSLTNGGKGVINANGGNGLAIALGGGTVTNTGLLDSTSTSPGNGGLALVGSTIDNTGSSNAGLILANGTNSHVDLQAAIILGGTLRTLNGGVMREVDRNSVFDNVTLDTGGNFHVTNNNYLNVKDTLTNLGTVFLDSAGNDTRLISLGAVTLTGGGQILLSDNVNNFLLSNFATAATLNNVNNTISGAGRIGDSSDGLLSVVNATKGVINASVNNALTIALGGATLTNTGLIESTSTVAGNGGLLIAGSVIDNTGSNNAGVILATGANSHVNLASASVVGGTLRTLNGGVIQEIDRNSVIDNATLDTGSNIHVINNEYLTLADTFTNLGTLFEDSGGNETRLIANGGVTLTGGGVVQLSDVAQNRIFGNAGAVLTNVNNTIQGSGQIGDSVVTFKNGAAGTINATGTGNQLVLTGSIPIANAGLIEDTGPAGLRIASTTINNTGTIEAMVAGSHVDLTSAVINGGVLATANGGVIYETDRGSVLNNVAISIASASTLVVLNNQYLTLTGTLTNQGTVAMASGGNETRLIASGTVNLTGGGVVTLSDFAQNTIRGDGGQALLINQDNLITGAGAIGEGDALFTLTNATGGMINASGGNALRITITGGTLTNFGLMEATSTGGLSVQSTTIDNTGSSNAGVILSNGAGSHVDLVSGLLLGGTLQTANGGIFQEIDRGGVIDSVVLSAGSGFNILNNEYLTVRNTISNKGTIALNSGGNDTRLIADGTVTLKGGGLIQMTGFAQNFIFGSAGAVLTNVDNTIQGGGQIGDGVLTFINQVGGTIDATGGARLVLSGGVPFTNAGLIEDTGAAGLGIISATINNSGTIAAPVVGSHVDLQSATINGGVLTSANGGFFQEVDRGSTLNSLTIGTGSQVNVNNNQYLALQGTVTNNGTIAINSGGNDTRLNASGTVVLTGGGLIQLTGFTQNLIGGGALTNVDNTIQGGGQIGDGGLSFTNAVGGLINATGGARLLLTGGIPFTNAGLIEDTGAAGLGVIATINNSGTIAAPVTGSHVDLQSATINGGLLTSANGGFFQELDRGSTLNGVTIGTGAQVIVVNNEYLTLQGVVTNQGTVQVNSGGNDTGSWSLRA